MTGKQHLVTRVLAVVLALILTVTVPTALVAQPDYVPIAPFADVTVSNWGDLYDALWTAPDNTPWRIEIDRNFSAGSYFAYVWEAKDITLASTPGNQFTITQPYGTRHFAVYGALTLENIIIDGDNAGSAGGGIRLNDDGSSGGAVLTIANGAILRNNNATYGGAVQTDYAATVILDGGIIENNNATRGGGVMLNNGGILQILDGYIQDNAAQYGAGVYASTRITFNMTGGHIRRNNASASGGGVYVLDYSAFNMDGGDITENNTASSGGAVFIGGTSTFNMVDGAITGNAATGSGGGIYVGNYSLFSMSDGTVSGNTAGTHGGGIMTGTIGALDLQGGVISGNSAAQYGGGVRVGLLTNLATRNSVISGVTVTNNRAALGGAGIAASLTAGTTLTIVNSAVTYNQSPGAVSSLTGGGVFISSTGQLLISDSVISHNQAAYGGGLHSGAMSMVDISSTVIANNTALFDGGGIFHSNYDYSYPLLPPGAYEGLTVDSSVTFRGNSAENGNFPPPHNGDTATGISQTITTSAFTHPLNNDDINFVPDVARIIFTMTGSGTLNGSTADVLHFVAANAVLTGEDIPVATANTGWDFIGWQPNDPMGHKADTAVVTFTAVFEPQMFNVTFDAGGYGVFEGGALSVTTALPYNTTLASPDMPPPILADEGWVHTGWHPQDPIGATVTGHMTFTATYAPKAPDTAAVTFLPAPGITLTDGIPEVTLTVAVGTILTAAHIPAYTLSPGWDFIGWYVEGQGLMNPVGQEVAEDMVITAQTNEVGIDVLFVTDNRGLLNNTLSTLTVNVSFGTVLTDEHVPTVNANPNNPGWTHSGWAASPVTQAQMFAAFDENGGQPVGHQVVAPIMFTATFTADGSASPPEPPAVALPPIPVAPLPPTDGTPYIPWQPRPGVSQGGQQPGAAPPPIDSATDDPAPASSPPRVLVRRHFINGFSDGTFQPDGAMTRAEMMQIFFNISNPSPDVTRGLTASFTDVPVNRWFYTAVAYLENRGIVTGFPDGTLRPNDTITNGEFAAMAVRFFNLGGSVAPDMVVDAGSHWAANYINLGFSHGWFAYFGIAETFEPGGPIPRAQAVALLNYYQGRVPNAGAIDGYLAQSGRVLFADLRRSHWSFYDVMEAALTREYYVDADGNEVWLQVLN